MKKILSLLVVCLLLPLQACAVEQWQEGKHYVVISDQATETPEVAEFFSFWCPHCYNFEPFVEQIKQRLEPDTTFNKVHVNFMRFTGPNVQDAATRAMLVGRAMNKEALVNASIFNYIHVQRAPVTKLSDLRNLFIVNGIDGEEFDKVANSFAVNNLLKKNNAQVEQYRRHIKGVPSIVVNGKYLAQFARGMTNDDFVELVLWLTKQP